MNYILALSSERKLLKMSKKPEKIEERKKKIDWLEKVIREIEAAGKDPRNG